MCTDMYLCLNMINSSIEECKHQICQIQKKIKDNENALMNRNLTMIQMQRLVNDNKKLLLDNMLLIDKHLVLMMNCANKRKFINAL